MMVVIQVWWKRCRSDGGDWSSDSWKRILGKSFGFMLFSCLSLLLPGEEFFLNACVCGARSCVYTCVWGPPLGAPHHHHRHHPSTSPCLMSGSDTRCLSLLIFSQTTKSHQNPAKRLWKPIPSKMNESYTPSPPPTHTALLEIITPRIGKLCQNKDDMTSKSSRGKKHRSDVMCSLCVICWSLFMGVMSLRVGLSVPWYVTLTVKIKLSLSLSPFIYSLSRNFLLI